MSASVRRGGNETPTETLPNLIKVFNKSAQHTKPTRETVVKTFLRNCIFIKMCPVRNFPFFCLKFDDIHQLSIFNQKIGFCQATPNIHLVNRKMAE